MMMILMIMMIIMMTMMNIMIKAILRREDALVELRAGGAVAAVQIEACER